MKNNINSIESHNTQELKEKYAQAPSKFIDIDGVNVHYRDEGYKQNEIPLVLMHGFGAHLYTFDSWVELLSPTQRIIRLDLPGFGLTGPFADGDYCAENYTSFLNKFLQKLDVSQCIIVGNSMGGNIAWNFTLDYPDMVKKLILIDAAGYRLTNKKLLLFAQMAKLPKFDHVLRKYTPHYLVRKTVEEVYGDTTRLKTETVNRYADLFRKEGNTKAMVDISNTFGLAKYKTDPRIDEINEITQPTLILWGEKDSLLPISDAKQFYENTPNSKLVIFEDAGHIPMEEIPERSIEPVLKFIAD